MRAVFVELPVFQHRRAEYLDDAGFRALQQLLMTQPEAGDLMPGAGGLRKPRFPDARRGKGKCGGLRVIYFWWGAAPHSGCLRCTTKTRWPT